MIEALDDEDCFDEDEWNDEGTFDDELGPEPRSIPRAKPNKKKKSKKR